MAHDNRLDSARGLLTEALRLLDEADAPADIGAHVDLAVNRLQAAIELRSNAVASAAGQVSFIQ